MIRFHVAALVEAIYPRVKAVAMHLVCAAVMGILTWSSM